MKILLSRKLEYHTHSYITDITGRRRNHQRRVSERGTNVSIQYCLNRDEVMPSRTHSAHFIHIPMNNAHATFSKTGFLYWRNDGKTHTYIWWILLHEKYWKKIMPDRLILPWEDLSSSIPFFIYNMTFNFLQCKHLI